MSKSTDIESILEIVTFWESTCRFSFIKDLLTENVSDEDVSNIATKRLQQKRDWEKEHQD